MTIALTTVQIREAAQRLRGYVRQTPVLEVDGDDFWPAGRHPVLKQGISAARRIVQDAWCAHPSASREIPAAGVVAASGGNHGCAVYAARLHGKQATIFVPGVCPPGKRELIVSYGATLRVVGDRYADALAASEDFQRDSGALAIHAFDQPETMLGQATVGLSSSIRRQRWTPCWSLSAAAV